MNLVENLGRRCDLLQRRRSPYPPLAWLERPNEMFPIVSDPERCREIDEEVARARRERERRVDDFHARVCDRVRSVSLRDNLRRRDPSPTNADVGGQTTRSLSPESAFLESLPAAHTFTPTANCSRLGRSPGLTDEERQLAHFKIVRNSSAVRGREQARQWREDTARKQELAEIRRRERRMAKIREQALLEERRIDYLRQIEDGILEKESKIYATELKRLVATRLLRKSEYGAAVVVDLFGGPYDSDSPLGRNCVLSLELRRLLRRLPPLCPCTPDWWETNPDKCQCSLANNWKECAVGLEKLMSISVHGSHCF